MDERAVYERLKRAVSSERLPCALVDRDAFDRNVAQVAAAVAPRGKTVRVATKSIRSPVLLRRALEKGGAAFRGLMTFAATEAAWLATQGFDDLLVAYPSVQAADLSALADATAAKKRVSIAVDAREHLDALARTGRARGLVLDAVLDLDVSYRPLGGLHMGVRRSPIRSPEDALRLLEHARSLEGVRVVGLMAYEAHVAGLTDRNPFTRSQNSLKRLFKRLAVPAAADLRARTVERARAAGFELPLVNGGGTGSLATTSSEAVVTEVTAGSAFLAPHLFDYYEGLELSPAASFALQVVRSSDEGYVTCHGGGWIASGEPGLDRLPLPWLPAGLSLVAREGAGEVQTPLETRRCAVKLAAGDPVFFRHAKAGELSERVNELLLVEGDKIVERAPTYRGLGQAFL